MESRDPSLGQEGTMDVNRVRRRRPKILGTAGEASSEDFKGERARCESADGWMNREVSE